MISICPLEDDNYFFPNETEQTAITAALANIDLEFPKLQKLPPSAVSDNLSLLKVEPLVPGEISKTCLLPGKLQCDDDDPRGASSADDACMRRMKSWTVKLLTPSTKRQIQGFSPPIAHAVEHRIDWGHHMAEEAAIWVAAP